MRLYLDTNILYFLLIQKGEGISVDVRRQLDDFSNSMWTSSVSVGELIHLVQSGKIPTNRKGDVVQAPEDIIRKLDDLGIVIVPITKKHLSQYAALPFFSDHKDPNDREIIAQAISDRATLVSCDLKFERYTKYGLDLLFNKR